MDDLQLLDEQIDLFIAQIHLVDEKCHLNHGPGILHPPAINYLCQYIGYTATGHADGVLRIPICAECSAALYDEEWLLFYCLHCNSSQWLLKSKAKKLYPPWEHVKFFLECPNCFEEEIRKEK